MLLKNIPQSKRQVRSLYSSTARLQPQQKGAACGCSAGGAAGTCSAAAESVEQLKLHILSWSTM